MDKGLFFNRKKKMKVSALFVRADSIYKKMGIDAWDKQRNALLWPGGNAIVAHPPCAQWGRLKGIAHNKPEEKAMAIWAVEQIRRWGGVLEHPRDSSLWSCMKLPFPQDGHDEFGGHTLCINQFWFGHPAVKKTFLYIVGIPKTDLPPVPIRFDMVEHRICGVKVKHTPRKKEVSKKWREATPEKLAQWMVNVAHICDQNKRQFSPQYN